MGGIDRTARIVIGLLFLAAFMVVGIFVEMENTTKGVVMAVLLVLATIPLASAGARKCPINNALGRDTYESED